MKRIIFFFIKRGRVIIILWFLYIGSFISGIVRYKLLLANTNPIIKLLSSAVWRLNGVFGVVLILISMVWIYSYLQNKLSNKNKIIIYLLGVLSLLTVYISSYLIKLENINFVNYLYSKYGLSKSSFELLLQVSVCFIVVAVGIAISSHKNTRYSTNKIISILVLGVLIWFSLMPLINNGGYWHYSTSTYNEIFENYSSIETLRRLVPPDGKVLLPPQSSTWPDISNPLIVRYFLFNRILISSTYILDNNNLEDLGQVYFIKLEKSGDIYWPIINEEENLINLGGSSQIGYQKLIKVENYEDDEVYIIEFK